MVRGEPSGADQELIERLAALGLQVSAAQLERWRGLGLPSAAATATVSSARTDTEPRPRPSHTRSWPGSSHRLTFNGAIIQTATESYRLAHTKAQAERAQVS